MHENVDDTLKMLDDLNSDWTLWVEDESISSLIEKEEDFEISLNNEIETTKKALNEARKECVQFYKRNHQKYNEIYTHIEDQIKDFKVAEESINDINRELLEAMKNKYPSTDLGGLGLEDQLDVYDKAIEFYKNLEELKRFTEEHTIDNLVLNIDDPVLMSKFAEHLRFASSTLYKTFKNIQITRFHNLLEKEMLLPIKNKIINNPSFSKIHFECFYYLNEKNALNVQREIINKKLNILTNGIKNSKPSSYQKPFKRRIILFTAGFNCCTDEEIGPLFETQYVILMNTLDDKISQAKQEFSNSFFNCDQCFNMFIEFLVKRIQEIIKDKIPKCVDQTSLCILDYYTQYLAKTTYPSILKEVLNYTNDLVNQKIVQNFKSFNFWNEQKIIPSLTNQDIFIQNVQNSYFVTIPSIELIIGYYQDAINIKWFNEYEPMKHNFNELLSKLPNKTVEEEYVSVTTLLILYRFAESCDPLLKIITNHLVNLLTKLLGEVYLKKNCPYIFGGNSISADKDMANEEIKNYVTNINNGIKIILENINGQNIMIEHKQILHSLMIKCAKRIYKIFSDRNKFDVTIKREIMNEELDKLQLANSP